MYLTFSFGFWCFHARAASHAPKYCAAAVALLLLLLAALSFWDFRCAFCCAPAATAALSSLFPCQHSVSISLVLLSQSCCCPVYTIYMCERASAVRSTFFSSNMGFFKLLQREKIEKFHYLALFGTCKYMQFSFLAFFCFKILAALLSTLIYSLALYLSLATLSVLLPSHVYYFYVWVCESPRTACCVCTFACVCV